MRTKSNKIGNRPRFETLENRMLLSVASDTAAAVFTVNHVPSYGVDPTLDAQVSGRVLGVKISRFKVAVYIRVGDAWWNKPYQTDPLTMVRAHGRWRCVIATGDGTDGLDRYATDVAAFLIPAGHDAPLAYQDTTLPSELSAFRRID